MRESVIYQDILEKGLEQGLEQGRQEGERSLTLRLLTRRVGEIPEAMRSRLDTLLIDQLENLGEALLDFRSIADLEAWFETLE